MYQMMILSGSALQVNARQVFTSLVKSFITDILTIWSMPIFIPVASMSQNAKGRFKFLIS